MKRCGRGGAFELIAERRNGTLELRDLVLGRGNRSGDGLAPHRALAFQLVAQRCNGGAQLLALRALRRADPGDRRIVLRGGELEPLAHRGERVAHVAELTLQLPHLGRICHGCAKDTRSGVPTPELSRRRGLAGFQRFSLPATNRFDLHGV